MAKQNPNVTYEYCFPKNIWKAGSVNGLSFLLQFFFQPYHQVLLFYKGICFIKHCAIVTSNNYYGTDIHFIKSSIILEPIIES